MLGEVLFRKLQGVDAECSYHPVRTLELAQDGGIILPKIPTDDQIHSRVFGSTHGWNRASAQDCDLGDIAGGQKGLEDAFADHSRRAG